VKLLSGVVLLIFVLLIFYGSPFTHDKPVRGHHYNSPEPILPMSFAHLDHAEQNCILCHHNYVDDSGFSNCMNCHMENPDIWPLLEDQFHDLCMGCHQEKAAMGIDGGPPRECMACHQGDDLP